MVDKAYGPCPYSQLRGSLNQTPPHCHLEPSHQANNAPKESRHGMPYNKRRNQPPHQTPAKLLHESSSADKYLHKQAPPHKTGLFIDDLKSIDEALSLRKAPAHSSLH
eukprot:1140610-Pelagomonas_calceolata.AAC.3